MDAKLLPLMYAALVFSVIAFLFILLGRIFLNFDTIYTYVFEVIQKKGNYYFLIEKSIINRGKTGWRYIRSEEYTEPNSDAPMVLLIFEKTRNRVKFF